MAAFKNRIAILECDITKVAVDAIVNAANHTLLGGGGVDGAIHRAGGPAILDECKKIITAQGGCATGEAVITGGGNLPAKFVIHTVGPVWRGGQQGEAEKLAGCYQNSLKLAVEHHCQTIAFPSISTGVYGFPVPEAAKIAVETVVDFLKQNDHPEQVYFVCFGNDSAQYIRQELLNYSL